MHVYRVVSVHRGERRRGGGGLDSIFRDADTGAVTLSAHPGIQETITDKKILEEIYIYITSDIKT